MGTFFGQVFNKILDSGSQQDDPGMQTGSQNQQNLFTSLVNRYVPGLRTNPAGGATRAPGANVPSDYDQSVPGVVPAHMTDESNPMDPNRYEESGAQGTVEGDIGNQSQWQPSPGGSPIGQGIKTALGAAVGLADGSTLVTQPTIAKIGERGPEMVVPLKARAGNRVQPDVLEGHLAQPKVPGMKYSRYKSFTDRAL